MNQPDSKLSTLIMKPTLWKLTLCAACVCASSLTAGANTLQRSDVMDDPAWLVHLDFDGFRPTTLGQYVLAEMDKPEAKDKLAAFQTIFSFDLRKQLHGATLYGSGLAPEEAVLIVYADFEADRLVTLAKAAKDYHSKEHNQHVIHNWRDDHKKDKNGDKMRVYATIHGERVIFSQSESRVALALDVLDRTAPSLAAGSAFAGLGVPGNSHFLEAAARKMDFPDSTPNAAMLKLAKSLEFVLGEKDKKFHAAITLVADTEESAGHIVSIAQGLLALAKLQTEKPEATKFADAVVIKQDGARAHGSLTLPAGDILGMIKADAARKAGDDAEKSEKVSK
ncbi:MAG: hypothetical protein JWR69_2348 [Pedosphaera sp.]|nr:hypothetical protein [Pedosphaera sp.]